MGPPLHPEQTRRLLALRINVLAKGFRSDSIVVCDSDKGIFGYTILDVTLLFMHGYNDICLVFHKLIYTIHYSGIRLETVEHLVNALNGKPCVAALMWLTTVRVYLIFLLYSLMYVCMHEILCECPRLKVVWLNQHPL